MTEKIDRVQVSQDEDGEWWLEFYVDDIRNGAMVRDIVNGMSSYINMTVDLPERKNWWAWLRWWWSK